ncbi:MAG: BCD family MFS transporter [Synechococcales cyanobacterium T60_A2020_003]|nr:BCD family MFS transporter [Synechococcales cyanobacterium T60_A2020_003]
MSSRDFSSDQPLGSALVESRPHINIFTMLRLGLYQMGIGLLSLLTLGVLNQVMISELRIPATIAAGAIAMYQFVAPARIWFGQMSDNKPLLGYHRTGYIWTGLMLQGVCLFAAVQVVWQLGASAAAGWSMATNLWVALLALMFALYGLCISAAGTAFTAMLVDVSEEENRSQLVGIVWAMLMVGIVAGAIAGQKMLEGITPDLLQPTVNRLFMVFPAIVCGLGIAATFGIEKRYSRFSKRSSGGDRDDQISLRQSLRVLTASRQTGFFFAFLLAMTVGLFLQQPVLEPYAREVFGMSLGESAGLNQFWGYGILAGMGVAGFVVVPRLGKQRTATLGCWFTAACFILVILSGLTASQPMLKSSVMLFGLASGILTNSAVSLMLDLTAVETAGTFVGAWGLAQAMAQANATVAGGVLLDLGRSLFSSTYLAFALVFACEGAMMLVAVSLLSRIDVQEFKTDSQKAIAAVLEQDLE